MNAASTFSALVLVSAMLALGAPARADVVMDPPPTCPPGALPATGHMGPHCAATECGSVADCEALRTPWDPGGAPLECAPAGLCLRPMTVHGGHGHRFEMLAVLGSCASDLDCADPRASCVIASRCIAGDSREGPVSSDALPEELSSPSAAGCAGAAIVLVILAGAALLAARRGPDGRTEDARALLLARGRATHQELAALAPDVSAALAPIADRVRVEVEEGEAVYVLEQKPGAREAES